MSARPLDGLVFSLLNAGVDRGVFPGAEACIIVDNQTLALSCAGNAAVDPVVEPLLPGMFFDIASLTKVVATTTLYMILVKEGKVTPETEVGEIRAKSSNLAGVMIGQLLSHCSGLPAWEPFYRSFVGDHQAFTQDLLSKIYNIDLEQKPGTVEQYSDLGYIVLQDLAQRLTGITFEKLVKDEVLEPLGMTSTFYNPLEGERAKYPADRFVPTQRCPWRGRVLRGEVDDENAWAMGGVAAHAGLFSTIDDLVKFSRAVLGWFYGKQTTGLEIPQDIADKFFRPAKLASGSDYCLGWHAPTPGRSTSGDHFSPLSIGHTGFTGTSLWIDLPRKIIVVLLTNRVHPVRDNERIAAFRPRFHDAIRQAL